MKRKSVKKKKSLIKKPRWQNRRQILFTLSGMLQTLLLMKGSTNIHGVSLLRQDQMCEAEIDLLAKALSNIYTLTERLRGSL